MRTYPVDDRLSKLTKRSHNQRVSRSTGVFDVFNARRERRILREKKSDGGDGGWMSGEKRREVRKVFRCYDD